MKGSLLPFLLALLLAAIISACRSEQPPRQSAEPSPPARFKGVKNFQLAVSDEREAAPQCRKLCEETCGGSCYGITEIYTLCDRENPGLKYPSGLSAGERLEMCVTRSPGFVGKYPYWYNETFQSEAGAPPPEKWPCGVTCH